jgi:hypothetical protein
LEQEESRVALLSKCTQDDYKELCAAGARMFCARVGMAEPFLHQNDANLGETGRSLCAKESLQSKIMKDPEKS